MIGYWYGVKVRLLGHSNSWLKLEFLAKCGHFSIGEVVCLTKWNVVFPLRPINKNPIANKFSSNRRL